MPKSGQKMIVRLNGEEVCAQDGTALSVFLAGFSLDPERVVVEYNKVIVPAQEFGDIFLKEGDTLEVVSFVGGG